MHVECDSYIESQLNLTIYMEYYSCTYRFYSVTAALTISEERYSCTYHFYSVTAALTISVECYRCTYNFYRMLQMHLPFV
jgi:hypothetical protein